MCDEGLEADLFGFGLVDVFHQHAFVLEDVTLALNVQDVVEVLVDLLGFAVLAEETTEDALAADPDDLLEKNKQY